MNRIPMKARGLHPLPAWSLALAALAACHAKSETAPVPDASPRVVATVPSRPSDVATSGSDDLVLPPLEGSSGCDLSQIGATDRKAFDAFDGKVHAAAKSGNAAAFADIVAYPLTVRRDGRVLKVASRDAFMKEPLRYVPIGVMQRIDKQVGNFCRDTGLMYGNGAAWASFGDSGYAIYTVNSGEVDPSRAPSIAAPETRLTCFAKAHTVVVDDLGGGAIRYRSWPGGTPTTAKPALVLMKGVTSHEGHGVCMYAIYTFTNGDTRYEVDEAGCGPDDRPKNIVGYLKVLRGEKELAAWDCFSEGSAR